MLPFTTLHWLDCNVFVEAKNGPYGFEIAPGFWKWLESASKEGIVRSPISVYNQLRSWKDPLSRWAKRVKSTGLFVSPDRSVQRAFGDIAVFVQASYEAPHAAHFLGSADPWVIAQAYEGQGIVVTHEILAPIGSKRVKIPNVCAHFDVQCISPYEAFRRLGLKLDLKNSPENR